MSGSRQQKTLNVKVRVRQRTIYTKRRGNTLSYVVRYVEVPEEIKPGTRVLLVINAQVPVTFEGVVERIRLRSTEVINGVRIPRELRSLLPPGKYEASITILS